MQIILFIILTNSILFSQFENVNVQLDMKQLRENDKYILTTFSDEIKNYLMTSPFAPGTEDLGIEIDIHFVFESITDNGKDHIVNAQVLLTNCVDQNYFTKGIEFPFSNGQSLFFSISFDPIASFLDYFAYMFIANELDTYEYMGGEQYFSTAEEIASEGKNSSFSRSWDDRWKKIRKIRRNLHLRSMKYYFFLALDIFNAEELNQLTLQNAIEEFYISLVNVDSDFGQERYSMLFLNAYSYEISEMLSFIDRKDILQFLIKFDEDNADIYKQYLK